MISSPMTLMNKFNSLCDLSFNYSRKEVYVKLQKAHPNIANGLFTDSEAIFKADPIFQQLNALNFKMTNDYSNSERQKYIDALRNVEFGTRLFATWRNTASIYNIDEAMADQALSAIIPTDTPSNIFMNLPEWAVYMAMPEKSDINIQCSRYYNIDGQDKLVSVQRKLLGFWAMHDNIMHNGKPAFCLDLFCHLAYEDDVELHQLLLIPMRLILRDDLTIYESFKIGYGESLEKFDRHSQKDGKSKDTLLDGVPVREILSLLLWLCVEEPDVTDAKDIPMSRQELAKPRFAIHKKTGVFIPPQQETHLTIAKRMGGEVRAWDKQVEDAKQQGLPKRKIPHIRRGHWASVWVGSGDNKTCKTYWRKPVFVNAGLEAV